MTYEEACEARVTAKHILRECKAHGVEARVADNGSIVDHYTGKVITRIGRDGLYSGRDVLNWLGY